jgi:hypothetical protein
VQNLGHPGNCSWTAWPILKKLDNMNKKNSGLQIFTKKKKKLVVNFKIYALEGWHEASSILKTHKF